MFSKSELQLLALLKFGLWGQKDDEDLDFHSVDWAEIIKMAQKQTTIGILYDGITLLNQTLRPDKLTLIELFGKTVQIEKTNKKLNERLVEVVCKYRAAGLCPVLLKGQGIGQYYPNPLHRQPGDIDLFFFKDFNKANSVAASWKGVHFEPKTTYHQGLLYKDTEIENHLVYVDFYSKKNKRAWHKIQEIIPLVDKEKFILEDFQVDVPSSQMNVIYIFLHLMHHFLQVGVGLRQVCDWICLLNVKHDQIDKDLFLKCVDELHLRRSMTALTYVVTHYLGLPVNYIPLDASTKQAQRDGEFMLRDILDMGNFGFDQNIFEGFERNKHLKNYRTYYKFLIRYIKLYRFYPSEVRAYPWVWLKSKF